MIFAWVSKTTILKLLYSLYGEEPDPEEWACPICEISVMGMPLELLCHHVQCKRKQDIGKQKIFFFSYLTANSANMYNWYNVNKHIITYILKH